MISLISFLSDVFIVRVKCQLFAYVGKKYIVNNGALPSCLTFLLKELANPLTQNEKHCLNPPTIVSTSSHYRCDSLFVAVPSNSCLIHIVR